MFIYGSAGIWWGENMATQHVVEIKNGAKDIKAIVEEVRRKLALSGGLTLGVQGDTITLAKDTQWVQIAGNVSFVKQNSDLEIYYNREITWTGTAYLIGCVLFAFITVLSPLAIWYFGTQEVQTVDNNVKQVLALVSSK